jgi:hypothetical protein
MGVLSPSLSFVDAQVDGGSIPSLATILSALAKRALAFSFHFIPTNGAGLEAGAGRPWKHATAFKHSLQLKQEAAYGNDAGKTRA